MLSIALIFAGKVKHLADHATAKFCGIPEDIYKKDATATVILAPRISNPSFETWLDRGYVQADGITQKLVERKKIKGVEVFKVESHFGEQSYVVKKGELFSHGKTIKEAKDSLKYKISSRDTSEFKKWKLTSKKPVDELIQAYRAITGACEFGVKNFCESKKLKKEYTVKEVIKLTVGSFGNAEFEKFFS